MKNSLAMILALSSAFAAGASAKDATERPKAAAKDAVTYSETFHANPEWLKMKEEERLDRETESAQRTPPLLRPRPR